MKEIIIQTEMKEEELKKEIEINLKNVYEGKPLTIPLVVLNGKFKKVYINKFGDNMMMLRKTPKRNLKEDNKLKYKEYKKAYFQRPEVKAHRKAYQKAYLQRPEVKARRKAYQKAYLQRPEVKARRKAYQKAYQKAYYQRKKQEKLK